MGTSDDRTRRQKSGPIAGALGLKNPQWPAPPLGVPRCQGCLVNDTTLRLHKLDIGTVIDLEAPRPLWPEHFVTSRGHGP